MRADELITLTRAEFEALSKRAHEQDQRFDAEEMLAIREQYEERVAQAEARRDELEWKLRLELSRIRELELNARRSADGLRLLEQSILAVFDENDPTEVRSAGPSVVPRAATASPRPQLPPPVPTLPALPRQTIEALKKSAPIEALKKPLPSAVPPAPPAEARRPTPGSHADTFRQAMANRKRYLA